MMSPSKSSVVLVAGSALMDLQGVMNKIDFLAKDMKMIPYIVILLIRDSDMVPDTVRNALSPPVVSLLTSHLNYELTISQIKVWIDKLGSLSSTFNFTCHGLSAKSTQLIMKRGRVNRDVGDVCQGGNIRVAFNQEPGVFEVEDNKMVEYNGLG